MNLRESLRFPAMRAAVIGVAFAFAFAVWAMVDALRAPALPTATVRPAPTIVLRQPSSLDPVDIDAAIDRDLFSPDRSAPDEPFRMPGEAAPQAVAQQAIQRPTVLGTAVSPSGSSFATAQLGPAEPRIVREGDRLGDFIVTKIERGHVVFRTSTGTRLDIAASAAPTQGTFNASINQMPVAPDTADRRGFFFRGRAAGRRGRFARDTIPPR